MRTIPFLFTFDQSLEMAAGVCISSLLTHASPDTYYDIFILHSSQSDFTGSRLNELPALFGNCRLTFRAVEGEFVGAYKVRGIPETAYYRLISPELIPEYDKILYSDVDVIFREDMGRYYDTDLGDAYFAGVESGTAFQPEMQRYLTKVLSLDWKDGYFYSGNLVINLRKLREDGLCGRFRELGRNRYKYQDMDIINVACNKRILRLGPSFCLSNYLYSFILHHRDEMVRLYGEDEIRHALATGIVHYNGEKPWKGSCVNMDIWWYYYRRSVFFDERFCHDFWNRQLHLLERLPLMKRIKILFRYPLDQKIK